MKKFMINKILILTVAMLFSANLFCKMYNVPIYNRSSADIRLTIEGQTKNISKNPDQNRGDFLIDDTKRGKHVAKWEIISGADKGVAFVSKPFKDLKEVVTLDNAKYDYQWWGSLFPERGVVARRIEIVERITTEKGGFVNKFVDANGKTLLESACEKNDLNRVKLLLENGAEKTINSANKNGSTALIQTNNLEIVKLLFQHGAKESINKVDNDGSTPLMSACRNNNLEIVKLLLENGAKETINNVNKEGNRAIYFACSNNNENIVKLLSDYGAIIDKKTMEMWDKKTVRRSDISDKINERVNKIRAEIALLFQACNAAKNESEIKKYVDEFLKKGRGTAEEIGKEAILFQACGEGNLKIVKLLLEETPELIDKYDDFSRTPLMIACEKNWLEIAKFLLDKGPKVTNPLGERSSMPTPLFSACKNGWLEIVKILLNKDAITAADINKTHNGVDTPLSIACYNNYLEIVKLLLVKGVIIEKRVTEASKDKPEIKKYLEEFMAKNKK